MLRATILAAARSARLQQTLVAAPVTRAVVARFVAGREPADALAAAESLIAGGLAVSLDRLGENTTTRAHAVATADAYVALLEQLATAGLTAGPTGAEVSIKLSALGQAFDDDLAVEQAGRICAAARAAGTTVTVDMEHSATTDATLRTVRALRETFPATGAVLQAQLRRTEDDCRQLAGDGARIRLCKGAYAEPLSLAFGGVDEIRAAYARCLEVLFAGPAYPMVATHDPRLVVLAGRLAARYGRPVDAYEHQMLFGVRPDEQHRIAVTGARMRVYVPYGSEWYGYLMRRLAERPANLAFFLRSVVTRS